jgi:hypothetical protein
MIRQLHPKEEPKVLYLAHWMIALMEGPMKDLCVANGMTAKQRF